VEHVFGTFGAGRVAWGSNFPSSAGTLTALRDLALESLDFLSVDERRAIFCDVALALYPRLRTM
jgi:predicted TIM-barrel fold metal-dependent hydrolase